MGEDTLEKVEAQASKQSPENAQEEANKDRQILTDKDKTERKSLKSGGRSGISDAFGRPVMFDSSEDKPDNYAAAINERGLDYKPDHAAQAERDAHGRVTKITNDGQTSLEVKYGPDGKPSEIKDRDGVSKNNGDGTWSRQNKQGQVVETKRADVMVMPDGEIHVVGDRGKGSIWHTDGSKSETDGKSEVRRDSNGLVTRVTYPDGRTLDATYDKDNKLVKFKDKDGSTLERDGDSWVLKDPQGKEIDRPTKVELSGNGDRTVTRGSWMVKTHPDGGKSEFNDAGTLVRTDAGGKVTDMHYPTQRFNKGGDEVQILYGDDKKPDFVSQPDGSFYQKKDGAWTHIGTNGKKIEDIKDIEVKADGETKVTDMHGNTSTRRADGSVTEIRQGESRTEFNARGQVTEIAYEPPERGTIRPTYDKDGNLVSVRDVDGTELRPVGGDWKRYRIEK